MTVKCQVSPSRVLRAHGTSSYHWVPKHLQATWPRPEQSHLLPEACFPNGTDNRQQRQRRTKRHPLPPPEPSNILKTLVINGLGYTKNRNFYRVPNLHFLHQAQRCDDFKLIRITCQAACHGKTEYLSSLKNRAKLRLSSLPQSPSWVLRAPAHGTSSYHMVPKHLRATWPRPEQSHLLPLACSPNGNYDNRQQLQRRTKRPQIILIIPCSYLTWQWRANLLKINDGNSFNLPFRRPILSIYFRRPRHSALVPRP